MAIALIDSANHLQSKTSELRNWIRKIKTKKVTCKRKRRTDLYIDAVLRHTLKMAEIELQTKQQQRKQRWQQMRAVVASAISPSFNATATEDCSPRRKCYVSSENHSNELQCDAIYSLDEFLNQLKYVKCNGRE